VKNIFQKRLSTKRLSLKEMWQLYKLLGRGSGRVYLFDEIVDMMETIHPENIKEALRIMYTEASLNPLEVGLMFAKGLKYNDYFEFQGFIKAINGSPK
jgi:hypothetical protein